LSLTLQSTCPTRHGGGPPALYRSAALIALWAETAPKFHLKISPMSIKSTIISSFEIISKEKELSLPPLTDDLILLDSGLDSLSFAIIVSRLENQLGIDPFGADPDLEIPITLGDLIRIYEDHLP